jgi:hypothetical protein
MIAPEDFKPRALEAGGAAQSALPVGKTKDRRLIACPAAQVQIKTA